MFDSHSGYQDFSFMANDKKTEQLGINYSTANGRLVKDILWSLIVRTEQDSCCKCGEAMTRETFSIEHVIPWQDSENPVELFFDLSNISFSHLKCNIGAARKKESSHGTRNRYDTGCRCDKCKKAKADYMKSRYSPEWRRERFVRLGT